MNKRVLELDKLVIKSPHGHGGIILEIQADGTPVIGLFDRKGKTRLSLSGDPSIHISDQKEKSRIQLFLDDDDSPHIHFRSAENSALMFSILQETPSIFFTDSEATYAYKVEWLEVQS